ncbi:MAG TPA: DUF2460 domain-containing protein [Hyphomicrobiales bacterium]|nr:DUF2460 domain-containing protein [Hyphomicrobiales bacterium]
MSQPAFHEVRFPTAIALGARGGPMRKTDIVALGSGGESRNARWADARRRWDAGWGIKDFAGLGDVVQFFEERRGRLYGFRWHDRLDFSSAAPGAAVAATDQAIGVGDGTTKVFALTKIYGASFAPYARPIKKPVAGTVRIAVAGVEQTIGSAVAVDETTGLVTFASAPATGAAIAAGFEFDVPVRFDTDALEIDLSGFASGAIPSVPVVEIAV